MARPTPTLISALRTTADAIENREVFYNWLEGEHCNCGLLVRTLLDGETGSGRSLHACQHVRRAGAAGAWSYFSLSLAESDYSRCPVSERTAAEMASTLNAAGLEQKDFHGLEALYDEDIRRRAGLPKRRSDHCDHNAPSAVVAYMRAWADMLEEELEREEEKKREEKRQKAHKPVRTRTITTERKRTGANVEDRHPSYGKAHSSKEEPAALEEALA